MKIINPGLDFYVDRLRQDRCFSFVRLGNGEWDCIFQRSERTGTGSQSLRIPALCQGLIDGIKTHQGDSSYFLAMQSRSYLKRCQLLGRIEKWLSLNAPKAKWYCGEVFTKASMHGRLYPLIAQLRKMNLVVVGPSYLKGLKNGVFPAMKFVPVRPRDCFITLEDIYQGVLRVMKGCEVILFSAGPTAKVLIHQLHGQGCSLIDFGSLWDPYVGKRSRRYHKRVTATVQKQNLYA